MNKLNLSVSYISHNEEENISRSLESVRDIASEIIILDSYSTDRTREIAESYGAKVFEEDFKGYAENKNSSLGKCSQDWVLFLDCDETLNEELKSAITEAVLNPKHEGYFINRKTYYLGKLMKYAWQPDKKLRLCKISTRPVWKGDGVHEGLFIEPPAGELNGYVIHYSYRNIRHHLEKTIYYAGQMADSYYKSGKNFRLSNLIFNPVFAFVKLYIINRGFLDGTRGLIAGFSTFIYTFLKYAFLLEKQLKENKTGIKQHYEN